jgi:hypothetical protein
VNSIERSIRQTYVALRWAVLVVVVLLLAAVLVTAWLTGVWQTSISAYYYTAAGPVFVAALCATGACLILYHADNPENLLLDFAGFFAFVVAFVPTTIDFDEPPPGTLSVPTPDDVAAMVQSSVLALLTAGLLAVLVGWALWRQEAASGHEEPKPSHTREAVAACLVALGIGLGIFFFATTLIENHAHWVAAVSLFVLLFLVVLTNARRVDRTDPPAGFWKFVWWTLRTLVTQDRQQGDTFRYYVTIARLMAASAIGLGLSGWAGFDHWIFWAEAVQILLFSLFWQRQTAEFLSRSSRGPLQLQA